MTPQIALHRRDFLRAVLAGSGLVLASRVGTSHVWAQSQADPTTWSPDIFLTIDSTGLLTIITHRSEMGTGIRTTLPLVLAEELDALVDRIVLEQAIGDARYGDQNTDGSNSIRGFYKSMRTIGASARNLLERAAAERWKVDPSECSVREHAVHHVASGQSIGFGDLVADAAKLEPAKKKELRYKSPEEWRYVGQPTKIYDLHDMTVGKATFAADVTPAGCVYAVIARSPVLGGRVAKVDDAEALKVPGVTSIQRLPEASAPYAFKALGGVAVIARHTHAAIRGRDALVIEWDNAPAGDNAQYDSDAYRTQLEAAVRAPGKSVRSQGDAAAALKSPTKRLERDYYLPLLAHAPMEPPAAVAITGEDGVELWACTQNPQAVQAAVAEALEIAPEKVICHVTLLGGGFGRKSKPDYCVEAALLSRELKVPVKVVWTREDDLRHDYYHACDAMHLEAGLDAEGNLVGWLGRSACPPIMSTFQAGMESPGMELGMGFTNMPYACENIAIEACDAPPHVRIGWLRSVANVFHAFGVSSFSDELAQLAGRDALEWVTQSVGNPEHRLVKISQFCAEKAGYGQEQPRGQAQGFAVHASFGSYVAVVATVALSKEGKLSFPRVDIAIDCGLAINPDRIRAQMEGSVIFGLSLTLQGAITAKDGAIVQGNFDTYPVQRMSETPAAIHVHILPSDQKSGGVGEPGVPPVAPAVCNAIARITGKRITHLPLTGQDLSWS
ncbi:MAG: xanthine dehydrogenase family protein molybdopterin-binding subunit [Planctomycetes bacterium]|nr:xanthine dehydrogenase family protein molybdopterin-binding subunit [Planctomycetota bacterium]